MATETEGERERRQEWKHIGAGFVLVAVGMIGLALGLRLSSHQQGSETIDLRTEVLQNRMRIGQLESELKANNVPIPPAPATTTSSTAATQRRAVPGAGSSSPHRSTTTVAGAGPPSPARPSPASTTTTTTTTTPTPGRVCDIRVDGLICIGG